MTNNHDAPLRAKHSLSQKVAARRFLGSVRMAETVEIRSSHHSSLMLSLDGTSPSAVSHAGPSTPSESMGTSRGDSESDHRDSSRCLEPWLTTACPAPGQHSISLQLKRKILPECSYSDGMGSIPAIPDARNVPSSSLLCHDRFHEAILPEDPVRPCPSPSVRSDMSLSL